MDPVGDDFLIRLWGTRRCEVQGEQTGNMVSELKPLDLGEKVRWKYKDTLLARMPILYETHVIRPHVTVDFMILRRPLSSDGEVVDRLVGVVDYGAVKGSLYDFYDVERPLYLDRY